MGRSSVQISGTRTTAVHRGCVKTPALRLRVENLSRFRQPENKNTDDPYGGKTIEKTMLRVLRACMFSHSLGHEERFPPPRLNGRCRLGQATFIGTHGNERDAPIADLADKTPHFFKASDRRRETP